MSEFVSRFNLDRTWRGKLIELQQTTKTSAGEPKTLNVI
jgi:hypothetical protein